MIKFLVFILSFLGLAVGILIAKYTKEEIKPGKKYFIILKKLILVSISFVILSYIKMTWIFFLGMFIGYFFREVYFYLGLAIGSSISPSIMIISALPYSPTHFFFLLSSLTFLFGLPQGTLLVENFDKNKVIGNHMFSAIIFSIGLILACIISYKYVLMFASGAILMNSLSKEFY